MTDPTQPPEPAPGQQPPHPGAAQPQQPYPGGGYQAAPAVNPYGDAWQAPAGSRAYVEQHFGPIAGFGQRAVALIVDTLLSMLGFIPAIVGLVLIAMAVPDTDAYGYTIEGTGNGGLGATGGLLIVLGILLSIAIHIWNRVFRMGRKGQSIGKKVVGISLIHEQTGQPIGALQCFLRELLSGLINQVFYLSYLWMLWDDNKQTLHDKVVHSNVIHVPKG